MSETLTLAVAQSPGELTSPDERLDWLAEQCARLNHVDLLLLPELFLTGYNIGDQVKAWAEPADGKSFQNIAALAQRHGITIHYGYAEKANGHLYNAAQAISPDGQRCHHYRKHLLPPGFESTYFTTGDQAHLFTLKGFSITTLICYDAEYAELARHVAALGADIILVPTALGAQWGWVARQMIPTRAYENGVFLAYANHAGQENEMAYLGESFIAGPGGVELARASAAPSVIEATLSRQDLDKARAKLPYLQDRLNITMTNQPAISP